MGARRRLWKRATGVRRPADLRLWKEVIATHPQKLIKRCRIVGKLLLRMVVLSSMAKRWKSNGSEREIRERLRVLLETTRAVPWEADAKTFQFTYVGPQAGRILGYPEKEWYQKDFWVEHVHPEDRDFAVDFCHKSSRLCQDYEFEYRMVSRDGNVVWLHDIVTVESVNAIPKTLRGFMIDITDRKEQEEQLKRYGRHLEDLVKERTADVMRVNEQMRSELAERKNTEESLSALYSVTSTASQSLDAEATLQQVIRRITEIFQFDATRIFLFDPQRERLHLRASFETQPDLWAKINVFERGQGNVGMVAESGNPIIYEDVQSDPGYQETSQTRNTYGRGYAFLAVFPIRSKVGILGVILCVAKTSRRLKPHEVDLITAMATQIGTAVENIKLFEETQKRAKELSLLFEIATVVNRSLDLTVTARSVMHKILEIFDFDAARVLLLDEESGELWVMAEVNYPPDTLLSRYRSGEGISGKVLQTGQPLLFEDVQSSAEFNQLSRLKIIQKTGFRGAFAIPIGIKGKTVGVMNFLSQHPHHFPDNEVQLIHSVADQLGVAVENARLYEQTRKQAIQLQHDFVERTRAQMELESSRIANRHKSEFLANMSHELRTPLNAIIGFTRLVLQKLQGQIPALQTENLQKVLVSAQHLHGLVNELMDLSRIEAGRADLILETVDLGEIVDYALSAVHPLAKAKCRFVKDFSAKIPPVRTDRGKVQQILINLLSNAAKFTERGVIKVSLCKKNKAIELTVSDTGIGIPRDQLDRIFEEFHQVVQDITTRRLGGSGLGLTITRKLVNLLGGEIKVESEVGKGSAFTVTLPIAPPRHIIDIRKPESEGQENISRVS